MRRRMQRVPDLAQEVLALGAMPAASPASARAAGEARFVDDAPYQLRLGAQRVDEYLEAHGLGWVVRLRALLAAVDYGDLVVAYAGTGRPPFHPRTLLGLIVYGIMRRAWSLRELEELAVRDLGAWWITGGHQPDHSTLGEFIARHQAVLTEEFFTTLVQQLVRRLQVAPGVVAGDGTVIEAVASRYGTLRREAVEQAAAAAAQAAAAAPTDGAAAAQAAHTAHVAATLAARSAARAAKGADPAATQIAPQEPEAVVQPRKDGAVRVAYKPSTLVHERGLIVGQAVHPSSETAVLPQLLAQHAAAFGGAPPILLLDAGYCTGAVLADLVARAINVLCPSGTAQGADDWEKAGRQGRFGKGAFAYDAERDAYRCPAGAWLEAMGEGTRRGRAYRRYGTAACAACPRRAQCTTASTGRTVERYAGDAYKEAMAQVLRQPGARAQYRRRAPIAERPFAELRGRQGLLRFHRRGMAGAAVEFALHCIAFDLKWALHQAATGRRCGVVVALWARTGGRWVLWSARVLLWAP
jgi:transposase